MKEEEGRTVEEVLTQQSYLRAYTKQRRFFISPHPPLLFIMILSYKAPSAPAWMISSILSRTRLADVCNSGVK